MIGYAFRWRLPAPQFSTAWSDVSDFEFVAAIIGPAGQSGAAGGRYEHTQASPLAVWTVNHNLGFKPVAVAVISPGGLEVNAQVQHISVNQLTITFAAPYSGSARIL